MKPDVKTAFIQLIEQARHTLPFHQSFNGNCVGKCEECAFKLLEYLDMDLCHWEEKLKNGVTPTVNDLYILAHDCKRVYEIIQKNQTC